MKNKFLVRGGVVFFSSALMLSCGSTDINIDVVDTDTTEVLDEVTVALPAIDYSVPTPNELFEIIKAEGGELNIELINSLENEENYIDLKSKSLNFGIYSADLGYMSCFDHSIEFLKYTKTI
jgi:hypothetical protein